MKMFFVFSDHGHYTFVMSSLPLLGTYGTNGEYFFAGFTREIDAIRYVMRENGD